MSGERFRFQGPTSNGPIPGNKFLRDVARGHGLPVPPATKVTPQDNTPAHKDEKHGIIRLGPFLNEVY